MKYKRKTLNPFEDTCVFLFCSFIGSLSHLTFELVKSSSSPSVQGSDSPRFLLCNVAVKQTLTALHYLRDHAFYFFHLLLLYSALSKSLFTVKINCNQMYHFVTDLCILLWRVRTPELRILLLSIRVPLPQLLNIFV